MLADFGQGQVALADLSVPSLRTGSSASRRVPGQLLALFQDLVNNFAAEIVHVLVLQLLNSVPSHHCVADSVLVPANHEGGRRAVGEAFAGHRLVALNFFTEGLA